MITRTFIKTAPWDGFRTQLCMEDLTVPEADFSAVGIMYRFIVGNPTESAWAFPEGVAHPDFNMFYQSRITALTDPYLGELICRLLYLNPKITDKGLDLMIGYIVRNFIKEKLVDSEVTSGKIWSPILTFEAVKGEVLLLIKSGKYMSYVPNSTKVVIFSRHSHLSNTEKAVVSREVRTKSIQHHVNSAALHIVEFLAEDPSLLKVTHKRISAVALEVAGQEISPYMSRSTSDEARTLRTQEVNLAKPFSTPKSEAKYIEYCKLLEKGMSRNKIVKELGVSQSTLVKFKKVNDED